MTTRPTDLTILELAARAELQMRILTPEALNEMARLDKAVEEAEHRQRELYSELPMRRDKIVAALKVAEDARKRLDEFTAQFMSDGTYERRAYGQGLHDVRPLLSDEELLRIVENSRLPKAVVEHLRFCMRERLWNRVLEAIRESAESVLLNLRSLIESCCEITGLDEEELIARTDFTPTDLHHDRLDSMIAELRAMVFLRNEGFQEIQLLQASGPSRRSDIVADRTSSQRYAFDAVCSSAAATRNLESLAGYLLAKYEEKVSQLDATRRERNCRAVGLVLVVNSDPALTWGHQRSYREMLTRVYGQLGEPPNVHLCLVTGNVTTFPDGEGVVSIPDDVSYPPWFE